MPVAVEHAGGGPVYFAWATAAETTFLPEHIRYDEYILRQEIILEEGKRPRAVIDMKNPGALLAAGRERWCWIAFDDGDGGVVEKFFGRIIAIPTSLFGEVITVVFEARPLDLLARKQALAATMKVAPYYDKLFIDPAYLDDPNTILQAYPGTFHHDPVTHEVTYSSYLVGEDGGVAFGAHEIVHDSLEFEIGEVPQREVNVDATVTWKQKASGVVGTVHMAYAGYYGQSYKGAWPKQGASLGSGYTVLESSAVEASRNEEATTRTFSYEWQNANKTHRNGDHLSVSESYTKPIYYTNALKTDYKQSVSVVIGDPETGRAASLSVQTSANYVLEWNFSGSMTIGYDAARDRTEHVMFTLRADLQPMITDDEGTGDIETLTLNGGDVGVPLPGETEPPIGITGRRSYFPTDRGKDSLEYVINVARSHIISKSRVAETRWTSTDFFKVLGLSLRMSASATDARRLPGGTVSGKITNIKLVADGDSGEFTGSVAIKSAAGYGEAVVEVEGEPVYADADVLGPEVQNFAGRFIALPSADIVYSPLADGPADDGLVFPLSEGQVVISSGFVISAEPDPSSNTEDGKTPLFSGLGAPVVAAAFNAQPPPPDLGLVWRLELAPLSTGAFETAYEPVVGPLSIPQQVDIEAS